MISGDAARVVLNTLEGEEVYLCVYHNADPIASARGELCLSSDGTFWFVEVKDGELRAKVIVRGTYVDRIIDTGLGIKQICAYPDMFNEPPLEGGDFGWPPLEDLVHDISEEESDEGG